MMEPESVSVQPASTLAGYPCLTQQERRAPAGVCDGTWASPTEPSEGGLPLVGLAFRALGPSLRAREMSTRMEWEGSVATHPCSSPSCPKASTPDHLVELFHHKETVLPFSLLESYCLHTLTPDSQGHIQATTHTHTHTHVTMGLKGELLPRCYVPRADISITRVLIS